MDYCEIFLQNQLRMFTSLTTRKVAETQLWSVFLILLDFNFNLTSGFSVTVLCNGKFKDSAIVTCKNGIGWEGGLDWLNLDCRYTAVLVNKTANSTGNSTGNSTTKTGIFRQNYALRTSGHPVFILFNVMYVLLVFNIYLDVF